MSDPIPSWLPPLVLLSEHGGDWEAYEDHLYLLYREQFDEVLEFRGQRVSLRRWPEHKGKSRTFWHIIQEDRTPRAQRMQGIRSEDNRVPDIRRCERIRWIRPIVEGADDASRVLVWENTRYGERHCVVALPDFSYLVALGLRADHVILASAYPVYENRRDKHRREYEAWLKEQ